MGILVSGEQNGVLIYDWRNSHKPSWYEWYNTEEAAENKAEKYSQTVTHISFNPSTFRIIMSGPNRHLKCFKIEALNTNFQEDGEGGGFNDVIDKIGPGADITHHCWDEGAEYLAICTDEGHIIVKRSGLEIEYAN